MINNEPAASELLSIRTLSKLLDCSPKTVQDWLYKDRKTINPDPLPYYRVGGLIRFRLTDVSAWLERRRVRVTFMPRGKRIDESPNC